VPLDLELLEELRLQAHSRPIVQTSIGPIDASASDLALDFPNADWDLLMTARRTHDQAAASYLQALLSHDSDLLQELHAHRALLAYSACPQCGGRLEPLQVLKAGVEPRGRTVITDRDYELCTHPYHAAFASLTFLLHPPAGIAT
jgi:hypothetical protein